MKYTSVSILKRVWIIVCLFVHISSYVLICSPSGGMAEDLVGNMASFGLTSSFKMSSLEHYFNF